MSNIPVLAVSGDSLAETWENSLVKLYDEGCRIKTEYDKEEEPASIDSTMIMTVLDPSSEPFIHRAFPGGLENLEEYRLEVLDGIKDHWIRDPNNPDDKRWEYTYHSRLTNYDGIDQLKAMVEKLAKTPYSRRCNAITWRVSEDLGISDPACLQSIWSRVLVDDDGIWHLNMNVRFRSRDAYDAAFMNMFAFISLQERLAAQISALAQKEVKMGRYCDISDSYHIYGRRLGHFKQNFLCQRELRTWEERTWTREFAQPIFDEARPKILKKIEEHDKR
jgi:thymidylate synthase